MLRIYVNIKSYINIFFNVYIYNWPRWPLFFVASRFAYAYAEWGGPCFCCLSFRVRVRGMGWVVCCGGLGASCLLLVGLWGLRFRGFGGILVVIIASVAILALVDLALRGLDILHLHRKPNYCIAMSTDHMPATMKTTCQFGPIMIGYWIDHNQGVQERLKQEAKEDAERTGRVMQGVYISKVKAAWASMSQETQKMWEWASANVAPLSKKRPVPQRGLETWARENSAKVAKSGAGEAGSSGMPDNSTAEQADIAPDLAAGGTSVACAAVHQSTGVCLSCGMFQKQGETPLAVNGGHCQSCTEAWQAKSAPVQAYETPLDIACAECGGRKPQSEDKEAGEGAEAEPWYCHSCWNRWAVQDPTLQDSSGKDHEDPAYSNGRPGGGGVVTGERKGVSGYTLSIPQRQFGQAIDADYVHGLLEQYVLPSCSLTWTKNLTNCQGGAHGIQYKTLDKKATVNFFFSKGTVYITGSPASQQKETLRWYITSFANSPVA